ncbi:MAG: 3-deoxy-manno-octulosonate cytidylyltransferase [Candidatus Riflebacteria bacterium]|nr:3-deoxy-manno-octulosonate cytidylyltransferase [Candidatus Riflebacteria bacterium]
MRTVGVIPARLASTRLPEKMLADISGRPMIVWVADGVSKSGVFDSVIVATDSEKIASVVKQAGFESIITDTALTSGTARVAAVAKNIQADVFVNIQGDEPIVDQKGLKTLVSAFADPSIHFGTLAFPLKNEEEQNPNCVKVVLDANNDALYFSRSLIPFPRSREKFAPLKHVGVYAYRRDMLLKLVQLPVCPLEGIESLEQLRALYHGIKIRVLPASQESFGVDTIEDLEKVREFVAGRK